jgi:succinyl-diaminopimelate desuccinylase
MHVRDWLLSLCEADSTTGREDAMLPALESILASLGARVERHPTAPGRTNVLALWGEPRVLFSTHLDTVPPFIPPRFERDVLCGRGSCDAKGQIVAQLLAIARLRAAGESRLAWLGVVGEEADSTGARAALALRDRMTSLRVLINGEPTHNVVATGQRGWLHLKLRCRGRAAHSGTPERGESAAWPMLDWLQRLRDLPRPRDPELGPEVWNLGALRAGGALNVVADLAEADLLVRSLPGSDFRADAARLKPEGGEIEAIHETPPERFPELDGFERAPVPFGSDAPRLRTLVPDKTVVLVGPGSIEVAHSPDEHLDLRDLERGVDILVRIARRFLA